MRWQRRASALFLITLLALAAAPVAAQGGSKYATPDPLNPPGVLPWQLPYVQPLNSPTPYPVRDTPTPVSITATLTPTPTPTDTPTPTPTFVEHSGEHDQIATLAAQQSDAMATLDFTGQQVQGQTMATAAADIGRYTGQFFAYAKGLQLFNVKGLGGVMGFLILSVVFVLLVNIAVAGLPIFAAIARWTFDLLRLVAEFLPF
jgi:hypothetical protein